MWAQAVRFTQDVVWTLAWPGGIAHSYQLSMTRPSGMCRRMLSVNEFLYTHDMARWSLILALFLMVATIVLTIECVWYEMNGTLSWTSNSLIPVLIPMLPTDGTREFQIISSPSRTPGSLPEPQGYTTTDRFDEQNMAGCILDPQSDCLLPQCYNKVSVIMGFNLRVVGLVNHEHSRTVLLRRRSAPDVH